MSSYIVIGAGLAGAPAAWHLAARGHDVTVLERTTPGNHEGSSHGSARIFRYAYPEQLYADLVVRAKAGWDELERLTGTTLITPTGAVDHGEVRQPRLLAGVLERAGVEHELLTATDAEERWPQFRFDTEVLWHPGAGVLDAVRTVEAALGAAEATGRSRTLTNWDVAGIEKTATGYRVHSRTGQSVEGEGVVVAAGGWLPSLLGDLGLPTAFLEGLPTFTVRQENAFHFPYRPHDENGAAYPAWPTFIHKSHDLQTYGLPGGRDADHRGQKMAQFNGGPALRSALDQDGVIDPANRRLLTEYARRWVPGVDPEPYAETTCLFTNTPSEDFVIDEIDGLVVVSACSGHGGKFAPLLGELAADLVTGDGTVPDEFRVAAHARSAA